IEVLQKLFPSPIFTQRLRVRAGRGEAAYWLPILALYSGARLEELGQLVVEDLKQTPHGISYFEVTARGEEQKIKGKGLSRSVSTRNCGALDSWRTLRSAGWSAMSECSGYSQPTSSLNGPRAGLNGGRAIVVVLVWRRNGTTCMRCATHLSVSAASVASRRTSMMLSLGTPAATRETPTAANIRSSPWPRPSSASLIQDLCCPRHAKHDLRNPSLVPAVKLMGAVRR